MLFCSSYSIAGFLPQSSSNSRFKATTEDIQFVNNFVDSLRLQDSVDRDTLKLHLRFCPTLELCNISTTLIKQQFEGRYNENRTCCTECKCDRKCYERADCCPDLYHNISKNIQTYESMRKLRCLPLRITDVPFARSWEKSVWAIDTCTNRTQHEYIQGCENVQAPFNLETHVPVTYSENWQIYRNVYCSRCNNVDDEKIIGWDVRLSCSTPGQKPISLPNFENYDKSYCFLELHPPFEINETERCATTGYFYSPYDREEKGSLCSLYQSPYNYEYRNLHCAFAKRGESTLYTCRKDPDQITNIYGYSFMLDFQSLRTWNTGKQTPDHGAIASDSNCSSEDIFVPSQVHLFIIMIFVNSNVG